MDTRLELLEHWWQENPHGPASPGVRQEVLMRRDLETGEFEVEHRAGRKSTTRRYDSEAEARYITEALRAGIVGWRSLLRRAPSDY